MKKVDELYICRICGYKNNFLIWGKNGLQASFETCFCCGCEFGFHDDTLEDIKNYRKIRMEPSGNLSNLNLKIGIWKSK